MGRTKGGRRRTALVLTLVLAAALLGSVAGPAAADVSAVKGSAFGVSAPNIAILGGAQTPYGPKPSVTLPSTGSATPITATDPSEQVAYGPAVLFNSGSVTVSTQGTLGPTGSVTSSALINNVSTATGGQLSADSISSTCTASASGVSGSTTVNNGMVATNTDTSGNVTATAAVPANPPVDYQVNGQLVLSAADTETFTYHFNEQTTNPDGFITVTAVHLRLNGPTTTGDLYVGQVVCGVTGTAATTTTTTVPGATTTTVAGTTTTSSSTTTTANPATTTTTPPGETTTTATPAATTTTAGTITTTSLSGGAYGYFASISLLGGAAATRGPAPSVTLPAAGSATPVTDSAASGDARFGPAVLFTSDRIDVSTQGTGGTGGSVTSSATVQNVNKSGQEILTAATVGSTCTASGSGASGSATFSGGKLTVSEGSNLDSDADDTVVQLPANPAANSSYDGKLESVGDTFRAVVNEQVRSGGGITVNAVHLFLLGPTAVGDLIIGQSRCGLTVSTTTGGGGTATGSIMARTGTDAVRLTALALALLLLGWSTLTAAGRRRVVQAARHPFDRRWF